MFEPTLAARLSKEGHQQVSITKRKEKSCRKVDVNMDAGNSGGWRWGEGGKAYGLHLPVHTAEATICCCRAVAE